MSKVVAYLRVSSIGQVDGDGFERQKDAVANFCTKHLLPLDRVFCEEGVTGTMEGMSRPAFCQMIEYIESHDLGGFVVERLDRLARDLMVQEIMLAECRKRGIQVFCADQAEAINMASNDGDPTRKLFRQILGALAEWEKQVIVHKLAVGRERKKKETGFCCGTKPYGSTPMEKSVLQFIISMRGQGTPWRIIAEQLNAGGTLRRCGKPWTLEKVIDVYKNACNKKEVTMR